VIARNVARKQSRSRWEPYVPLDCFAIARPEGRASFDALSLAMTTSFMVRRLSFGGRMERAKGIEPSYEAWEAEYIGFLMRPMSILLYPTV
jgi:hypothetical protein